MERLPDIAKIRSGHLPLHDVVVTGYDDTVSGVPADNYAAVPVMDLGLGVLIGVLSLGVPSTAPRDS